MFNLQIWNFWYQNETLKIFCQNVKTLQDLCSSKCTKVHFNPKWEAFLEVQKHYWVSIEIAYQWNVAKYWCSKDGRMFFSDWTHRLRLECSNWIVLVLTSTCSNISTLVIDRTFGSVELFGRTFTVRFGPNDRTFFCRTQNLFFM